MGLGMMKRDIDKIKREKKDVPKKKVDTFIVKIPSKERTLLTHSTTIIKKIVQAIRIGASIKTAACDAGIDHEILRKWLAKGEAILLKKKDNPKLKFTLFQKKYVKLVLSIRKAKAYCELQDLKSISKAAETDWKAAAWRLARTNNKRWSGNQTIEHKHSGNQLVNHSHYVEVDVDLLPMDVCEKLRKVILDKRKGIATDSPLMIDVKPDEVVVHEPTVHKQTEE